MKKLTTLSIIFFTIFISFQSVTFSQEETPPADSTYEGNVYSIPETGDSTYHSTAGASSDDTVEVFVIDNFILPDQHNLFVLSYYTSEKAKSFIRFDDNTKITISDTLTESHKDTIDVSTLKLKTKTTGFVIEVEDSLGRKYTSERYELEIPEDVEVRGESNFLLLCLFGGTVFALPYPEYIHWDNVGYFGITKEIPLVFLRSSDYEYPMGYFSLEYSFVWGAPVSSLLRIGYKHIIKIHGIEYVSPGISGITNFKGYNGLSPEVSVGWFKIFNVFTVYSRFRYNVQPGVKSREFIDISIGLYSGFFAIYF